MSSFNTIENFRLKDGHKLENLPDDLNAELNNKVDKEIGKQLSTEDFTTNEKNKLAWIEAGATMGADWNVNVINKPQIPTKTSDLSNDSLLSDVIRGTNITIDKNE